MRWYFSYPILAAGLVFGVHTYLPQDHARARRVEALPAPPPAEAIELAAVEIADPSRLASFAPDARLFAVAESTDDAPGTSVLDYLARTLTTGSFAPALFTPTAPQQPVTAPEWKSAVVLDVRAEEETIAPTQPRPTLSPRVSLTRDIQRELKRVGCYVGDIDGVWGGGSKQAIVLFMDRVNASLPTQEPDVFMLSLLRAETTAVCGTSCPSGQSLTGSGRCVPSTLMVQNERGGQRLQRVAHAAVAAASADEEPDRSFEPTSATWDPVVTDSTVKAPSAKALAAKAGPARRVPLEGRMAIGGPVPPADAAAAIQTGSLQRTAALEPQDAPPQDTPLVDLPSEAPPAAVRPTSFDTSAVVDRPARVTGSRPKAPARAVQQRRGTSTYRHVQRLFQHPLGSL